MGPVALITDAPTTRLEWGSLFTGSTGVMCVCLGRRSVFHPSTATVDNFVGNPAAFAGKPRKS